MCQAIVKPFDVQMYRKPLALAWSRNPDGGGFAYTDGGGNVQIEKGFTSFHEFWKAFREHQHQNVLIHFRWATHGDRCAENTHPFVIGKNLVMAHNGVLIDYLPTINDKRSDSRIFAEDYLAPAIAKLNSPMDFICEPVFALLTKLVGTNKLVFLTPNGFYIINESLGSWDRGIWWSGGVPRRYTTTTYEYGTTSYITSNGGTWLKNSDGTWTQKTEVDMSGESEDEDFEDVPEDAGYDAYQQWQRDHARNPYAPRFLSEGITYNKLEQEALRAAEDAYDQELSKTGDDQLAELAADVAYDSWMAVYSGNEPKIVVPESKITVLPPTMMQSTCYLPAKYRKVETVLSLEELQAIREAQEELHATE